MAERESDSGLYERADARVIARRLAANRRLLCATPAYLARHGTPLLARDLERHATVRFRHPDSGKVLDWPLLHSASDAMPRLRTALACNNMEAVLDATVRGLGIACLPDFLVYNHLADHRLQSILEDQLSAGGQFKALWPSSRHLSPKVRVFVDHLGAQLASPGAIPL